MRKLCNPYRTMTHFKEIHSYVCVLNSLISISKKNHLLICCRFNNTNQLILIIKTIFNLFSKNIINTKINKPINK